MTMVFAASGPAWMALSSSTRWSLPFGWLA